MKTFCTILSLVLASAPTFCQNTTACGAQLTEQSGVITSPDYPNVYPNNSFCRWFITAKEKETIDLRFTTLDLEGISGKQPGSDTCPDYVRVYDGPTVTSPLIAIMCRIQSQSQLENFIIRSTRNEMLILFMSDSGGQRPGFVAHFWAHECPEFTYGTEKCNLSCNCDKSKTVKCNNTNGACICKSGWGSHDCSQDIDECVNGTVEACPHHYQECANTVGSFQCQCMAGLIQNSSGQCEVDPLASCQPGNTCSHVCVKVASPDQMAQEHCYCPDNMRLVGNTCKACINLTFGKDCLRTCSCTASNTKSCNSTTGGCVCLEGWTSPDCSKDINECTERRQNVCPNPKDICVNLPGGYECRQCNFTLTNSFGTIESPNYPDSALDNTNCAWTIRAPEKEATISFNLTVFQTTCADTYRDICCNEALNVYDGDSSSALLLGRYCGNYKNLSSVVSSGNTMYIVFHTRTESRSRYFAGAYSTNKYQVYRYNLTALYGNITSPAYSPGSPVNVYSTWTITVTPGHIVTLRNFSSYGLQDCDTDFVEVHDGSHAGANTIGHYCGRNLPTVVSSTEKSMYIIYSSLKSTAEKGFNANYVADACKCSKHGTVSCNSPTGPCVCKNGTQGVYCDQDVNECPRNPCPAHSTCINTWGSFYCVCLNGSNVDPSGFCNDWEQILTSERGDILSQEFPHQYPSHVNYNWNITGQSARVVSLRFSQFDLEATPKCWSDVLEIYDASEASERLIGQYCGKNIPDLLRTQGNKMRINFKTDGTPVDVHTGFNASYHLHECPSFMYGDEICNRTCPCNADNTQFCDNVNGVCFCKPGWVGQGCSQDLDECRRPRMCPRNSDCINEAGKYTCECHAGYVMNDETHLCVASSSCGEKMRKQCSHLCDKDSLTGKDKCHCPEDMALGSDQKTCLAILYPHGLEAADNFIDPKRSPRISKTPVSEPVKFSTEVPVGKSTHSVAYVLYNGVILFDSYSVLGSPNLKAAHIGSQNLLAPLWADNRCFGTTEVSYHLYETCESSLLEPSSQQTSSPKQKEVIARAVRDIQKYHKRTDFEISSVLVATWTNFQSVRGDSRTTSIFQAILVNCHFKKGNETSMADKEESFVIFNYKNGEHTCLPEQPFVVGVATDDGMSELKFAGKKPNLADSVGNTGDKGVVTFKVGASLTPSQLCHRYLCKHSDLMDNPYFKAETAELFKCPCSLDRLGLQWELVNHTKLGLELKTKCYAISRVAKRKFLHQNQRNRLCCYSWTPPASDSWKDWLQSWQDGSLLISSSHPLISDPWESPSSFGNTRAYQDAAENIKAHRWCCEKSSFTFCNRFNKIFGGDQCEAHSTFVSAHALGDPTINTLDKRSYPMNGWGEYILMEVPSDNFTLQARTQRTEINGILSNGTGFTAFAAQEQNFTRFQVQLAQTNTTMVILANGMDLTNLFYSNPNFTWSTETISVARINQNSRVVVAAVFQCGVAIKVHVGMNNLMIDLEVDKSLQNKTRGLLGTFNGDPTDDFLLPNGSVLPSNITEREILDIFAREYLVTASSSVFTYDTGETTNEYQYPEYVPMFLDEAKSEELDVARSFCGSRYNACIHDFIATDSVEVARNTKSKEEEIEFMDNRLENTPPTIRIVTDLGSDNYWLVHEGRENYLQVEARDDNDDPNEISYLLTEDATGVVLHQDGSLIYTPDPNFPIQIGIRARDSQGAYSPILKVTVVVCPACNGKGDCGISESHIVHQERLYQVLKCHCSPAYTGENCESELDACTLLPCVVGQTCTDLTAAEQGDSSVGYVCGSCPAGTVNVNGSCEDLDKCLDKNVCDHECVDTYRSYICSCRPGYRLDYAGGRTCLDVDECEERTAACTQECRNTMGSYSCSCKQGYTLSSDNRTCNMNATISALCHQCEHICEVITGNIKCGCNRGYMINESDPTRCEDVDECNRAGNSPCSQKCSNTMGHFQCSCHPGYKLDTDGVTCVECENPSFGDNCSSTCECRLRGTCDKVRGCICDHHWTGAHCERDVNECADAKACADGFICVNEPGFFSCVCPEGYRLENGVCTDIDECTDYISKCDLSMEECHNNVGNYSCRCQTGFGRNTATGMCEDINECDSHIDGCEHICKNGPGSYRCVCHQGYRLAVNRHKCEKNKEVCNLNCSHGCSLVDGSPACICPRGYRIVGSSMCEDINECLSDTENLCGHKDRCTNIEGDHVCSCQPGYRLENDGRNCTICDGGTWGVQCNISCSCGTGALRCDPVKGCICKPGHTGEHCTDVIDRCANGELKCLGSEECVLIGGNSVCQCRQGYIWHLNQCQDENECLKRNLHNCDQVCTNTEGSFNCSCHRGYMYNATTNTCQDVDECQQDHNCSHICINTDGSYRCSCHSGSLLQADGVTCDACPNGCSASCDCVENNTDVCDTKTGQCKCRAGWTGDRCSVDVNECLDNPCPKNQKCNNVNGSYQCLCWNGLQPGLDGDCKDCNRTLTGNTGYLMTSNYPQFYQSNSYCSWTIVTNATDAVIVFRLNDYDMEGCPHDYLDIYDGSNATAPLLRQICDNWHIPVKSKGASMHIVFKSDFSYNGRGFHGRYVSELPCKHQNCSYICNVTSVSPWTELCLCPEWQKLAADGLTCIETNACSTVITEPTGLIVSKNFPAKYPLHFTCNWTLQAEQGRVITFSFLDFDLEASSDCVYDYVKIYDGSSEKAPLLGGFCGTEQPPNVTSSTNTMHIVFHSDDSENYSGFKGFYLMHF